MLGTFKDILMNPFQSQLQISSRNLWMALYIANENETNMLIE